MNLDNSAATVINSGGSLVFVKEACIDDHVLFHPFAHLDPI